jgi:pilus assembly protein CpaB
VVVNYARTADRRALAGQQAVRAFVAVKQVPAGTTADKAVRQGLIVPKLIARTAVPADVLTSIDGGYDQLVATSVIQPGELVLRPRFAARGTVQGTLVVPDGLLAVSVALEDPAHVGSFATVGSRVAVFDTFNIRGAAGAPVTSAGDAAIPSGDHLQDQAETVRATRLLIPSVEVLAVGASTAGSGAATGSEVARQVQKSASAMQAPGSRSNATLFTLAVTQGQAQQLIHSSLTGTLTFALLGPGAVATPGKGVQDHTLFEVTK